MARGDKQGRSVLSSSGVSLSVCPQEDARIRWLSTCQHNSHTIQLAEAWQGCWQLRGTCHTYPRGLLWKHQITWSRGLAPLPKPCCWGTRWHARLQQPTSPCQSWATGQQDKRVRQHILTSTFWKIGVILALGTPGLQHSQKAHILFPQSCLILFPQAIKSLH